ncbi:hypothetical protein IT568_03325 [bacterium]|nr:hypothetical protein [bacterium]
MNRVLLLFLVFYSFSCSILQEEIVFLKPNLSPKLPQETEFSKIIDLNGDWFYLQTGKNNFEDETANWQKVKIPSCYEGEGNVIFKKVFRVDTKFKNKTFKLNALGINYKATIRLNGDRIGNHIGGYNSFKVNIDPNLINFNGENTLEILVENTLDKENTLPLKHQIWGWRNYGGIFREIFILIEPEITISEIKASPEFSPDLQNASLNFSFLLEKQNAQLIHSKQTISPNSLSKISVGYEIEVKPVNSDSTISETFKNNGKIVFEINETGKVNGSVKLTKLKLWELNDTNLYEIRINVFNDSLLLNSVTQKIGFKETEIRNNKILLNGKQIKIQGVNYFEELKDYGNSVPANILQEEILTLKSIGCNLIYSFFPLHPYVLELCNNYGILVIEQIPLWAVPKEKFQNKHYIELIKENFFQTISRDRLNVSVFAWSVGGRFDSNTKESLELAKSLIKISKELDYRPLACQTTPLSEDLITSIIDLPILNLEFTPIETLEKDLGDWQKRFPSKPLVTFDYGYFLENTTNKKLKQENELDYQAKLILDFLEKLDKIPTYCGGIIAAFNEWKSDEPMLTRGFSNEKMISKRGLVDYERKNKKSFEVVAAKFSGNRLPFVSAEVSEDSTNYTYSIFGLILLLALGFMYSSNQRFRENFIRSLNHLKVLFFEIENNRVAVYDYLFQQLFLISAAFSLSIFSFLYTLKRNTAFDCLLSQFLENETLKNFAVTLIWRPIFSLPLFSVLIFMLLLASSVLISMASYLLKFNLSFRQITSVLVWSGSFVIFTIPVGMFLPQIIGINYLNEQGPAFYFICGVYAFILLNLLYRISDGITIVAKSENRLSKIIFTLFNILVVSYLIWYFLEANQIFEYYKLLAYINAI